MEPSHCDIDSHNLFPGTRCRGEKITGPAADLQYRFTWGIRYSVFPFQYFDRATCTFFAEPDAPNELCAQIDRRNVAKAPVAFQKIFELVVVERVQDYLRPLAILIESEIRVGKNSEVRYARVDQIRLLAVAAEIAVI
jgi:hypothetical protein